MGVSSFYSCGALTSVAFEDDCQLNYIRTDWFQYTPVQYILNLPAVIRTIPVRGFHYVRSLRYLSFAKDSQLQTISQ